MLDLTWLIVFMLGCILIHKAERHATILTPFLLGTALFLATLVGTLVYHQAMVRISANLPLYEAAAFGIAAGR